MITKSNILDLIYNEGILAKKMSSPNFWACEDSKKSNFYSLKLKKLRLAWIKIKKSDLTVENVGLILKNVAPSLNKLIVSALRGELEVPDERLHLLKMQYFTNNGDLYHMDWFSTWEKKKKGFLKRVANTNVPEKDRKFDGVKRILELLKDKHPNFEISYLYEVE